MKILLQKSSNTWLPWLAPQPANFSGAVGALKRKRKENNWLFFWGSKPALIASLVDLSGNSGLFMTHIKPKGTSRFDPFLDCSPAQREPWNVSSQGFAAAAWKKATHAFSVWDWWHPRFSQTQHWSQARKGAAPCCSRCAPGLGLWGSSKFLGEAAVDWDLGPFQKKEHMEFLGQGTWGADCACFLAIWHPGCWQTSWSITIQVAVRSQNGPQSRVAVTGPRKIRTLGYFIPEDYSAANDSEVLKDAAEKSSVQNVPLQPPSQGVSLQRDGRASPARGRSRSPKGTNEVAATVPDSQSQGEETSSPVKVDQGPPKKPKISEPSDPTQAIDSFGWRHWDQGGTGDCFFRVASVFMSNAAERPSAEDSRRDGAWLRAQTCQHLKKHEVRFGQLFQNKSEWATWLASVARPNTWAEGKALQALSEKIGKPLIIWEKKTEVSTVVFTRFVVAPKFSKGFRLWC